ncbi:DNA-binding protein [Clostridium novyi B str. ATCC 27606]|uniref:DNA-binding protein n=2 Tax=Clostridium novyi TaxID=1542 RepID=A0AA40IUW8_CLONO|nr:DNA-binding protein [Clostridium novyi B str. ATCC 27606]
MNKENETFCTKCNKIVNYKVRKDVIKYYREVEVNVEENIAVCNECNEDIFVMKLEIDNLKRLYKKYEQLTGICVKPQFARSRINKVK